MLGLSFRFLSSVSSCYNPSRQEPVGCVCVGMDRPKWVGIHGLYGSYPMPTVALKTYCDMGEAQRIEQEAERLDLSLSEYLRRAADPDQEVTE